MTRIVPISERYIEGFREAIDVVAREKKYLALTQAPALSVSRRFVRDNLAKRNPQFVALVGEPATFCIGTLWGLRPDTTTPKRRAFTDE